MFRARKRFEQLAYASYLRGRPQLSHLPVLIQYNVQSALLRNSELLGVGSEYFDDNAISMFKKQGPDAFCSGGTDMSNWPPTLHPIRAQYEIEHHPWLDLFPLPRMRENFLRAIDKADVCDEDELCWHIAQLGDASQKAGLLVWGMPWDPRGWEVTVAFLRKWGFLLEGCPEIIEATNYWRAKQGKGRLSLREVQSNAGSE